MRYKKLFSKGQIGNLELKNRIVMPPMGVGMAHFTGEVTDEIIRYYEERAKGGCGLIITEITRIDDETGIGMPNQMGASSPIYIRKLTQLADAVHKYDSKIFLQLHHAGREVGSAMLKGKQPVAPSAIPCPVVGEIPRELTTEECDELVKKFITGAKIGQIAGFDGVELHAAHGYLINQFLSPYTNKRDDKYGGDYFRRLNFIANIIIGIRAICGPDFPVSVRLSTDEFVEGGLKIEDSVKIARSLESFGVKAINVSAGTYESGYSIIEPQLLPEGWKKHLATEIKKNVSIPVIAVNNIKHPAFAEQLLEEGVSDFVAIGRGQLADPEWGVKAKRGEDELIHKCLGCMYCFKTISAAKTVACTINPRLGRELTFNEDSMKKDGEGRAIAVIGGGPAGMQAAYVLAKRGFKPVLFEKSDALGGSLKLAEKPSGKRMIGEFIDTQKAELEQQGVEVRLNTEPTIDAIKQLNPYGVMMAVGGSPIMPQLPGVDKAHVHIAENILDGSVELKGKKVVVAGGGLTGLETAEILARSGNQVTVLEMMGEVGTSLYKSLQLMLLKMLGELKVDIKTHTSLSKIGDGKVTVMSALTAVESEIDADAVVLALGVRSNKDTVREFEQAFEHVTTLGDASKPGQIADAMREANDKAYVF